jgi:UDP-N-acetylmuramoyl-tripeptide--D-alanyl-D-alanine ligase
VALELPFASRYNAENALAALAAYDTLGLPLADAQRGASEIRLSRWRGEELELPGGGLLINDCYNANPISMAAALDNLAERAGQRRKVAVLGGMAELGPEAGSYHRAVGKAASRAGVSALVAVGPLARGYVDGAEGILHTRWTPTVDGAVQELTALLAPGDCVLVKGSRAVGLEVVAEALAAAAAPA